MGIAGCMQMDRIFMFMKKMSPGGCLPLPRSYVYDHNIQTSPKLLGQSKKKFYVKHLGRGGGVKVCINDSSHMTKMATWPTVAKHKINEKILW